MKNGNFLSQIWLDFDDFELSIHHFFFFTVMLKMKKKNEENKQKKQQTLLSSRYQIFWCGYTGIFNFSATIF